VIKKDSIVLADDDEDDALNFRDALKQVAVKTPLTVVANGEELMRILRETPNLPQTIFLDLNMPRKNGFECLREIRANDRYKDINIIIFSTSQQEDVTDSLYYNGAQYYIRKPADFHELTSILGLALNILEEKRRPSEKDDFVLKLPTL
jgi:CheY-like chemotaxis protein